jgi:hypothetical protein
MKITENYHLLLDKQKADGDLFEMVNVLLWNVYNNDGQRVGQTAVSYDRNLVRPVAGTDGKDV